MKILGLGVPELVIIVVIIGIVAAVVISINSSSKKPADRAGLSAVGVKPDCSISAEELKKYKELLDLDAISQDEYEAKKKELLGL